MKKTLLLALALFATIGLYAQQPGRPQLPKAMTEYEKGTKPSETNRLRQEYPRIDPQTRKAYFKFYLPLAHSVTVSVPNDFKGTKDIDGVWTIETDPLPVGFHYYFVTVDGARLTDPNTYAYYGYGLTAGGIEVPEGPEGNYYRFNKDFITYKADSIEGTNRIDLTLVLHPYQDNQGTVKPHSVYTIGSVNFLSGNPDNPDIPLREKVLRRNTFLEVGDVYSARQLRNTYNHFGRLGIVRYTSINFHEHDDEPVLDCDINLSTNKSSTISFQPEGTNTAGDFGAAATVTFQNRNIFHGSENLSIELRGAYEAIKNLEGYGGGNYIEYSVGTKLTFPRFIAPFLSSSFRRRINATSELAANYDLQNRPEFHRRVFSVGWKYRWNDQGRHDRYQVDLLDLNYIYMPWISPTFEREYLDNASSRNAILRYNYENLFIMKFGVGYSYNNNRWAIRANVETAGNLLNWAARAMHFHVNEEGQYTFLNIAYAQYARGTFDFTRNINLDFNNQLVFHVGFGIAYPYGNSTILPFEKRYFSGGANSVRGWSVRSLGPGKFVGTDGRIDFINQTGDMKLDLNVEYRAKLFWKFSGALFIDAGNIWTLREYDEQPGGQFKFSEFFEQLAASYGLGVRLNFDFFIVRFDMGMKAVNPAYSDNVGHFPLLHPKFSRDFAFHFAVGLPF